MIWRYGLIGMYSWYSCYSISMSSSLGLICLCLICCSFELRVRISISPGKLTIIPRVRNTDTKAFSFMFALQNYLYVSDIWYVAFHPFICASFKSSSWSKLLLLSWIASYPLSNRRFLEKMYLSNITWHLICSEVRVEGLETLDYLDNLMRRERFTEQADAITFDGEVMWRTHMTLFSA